MNLTKNQQTSSCLGYNGRMVWILFCVQYCMIIIVLGIGLSLLFGYDLTNNSKYFQSHLEVYICLYVIGILFFIVYHLSVKTLTIFLHNSYYWLYARKNRLKKFYTSKKNSISGLVLASGDNNNNDERMTSSDSSCHVKKIIQIKTGSGKYGLKLGIKTFVVVFITVILMELIIFLQQKLQENRCPLTKKEFYLIAQLVFVILQSHFVLTAHKEDIEKFSTLSHFGVAHSIATTICTGFLLTSHDCLLKLYYYQDKVYDYSNTTILTSSSLNDVASLKKLSSTATTANSQWKNISASFLASQQQQTFELSDIIDQTLNDTTCSFRSYIDRVHDQIKPYSFRLCMLYVHCCGTLLCLLMLHLRKRIHKPSSSTNFFVAFVHPSAETFSAGAGLSLVVLGVIISVLTVTAENNLYITVFLLFLHLQASCVGLFALYKIADVKCARRKTGSKNHAIFMIFYFFLTLSGVLKMITINIDRDTDREFYTKILHTLVEFVDMIQAFVNALLVLLGFYVTIDKETLQRNNVMPTKILIHLAATNLAALISSIFSSKTEFSEFVDRLEKSAGREDDLFSAEIAWTVIESILVPCEEFHRFFTIVCLIKLHKAWSPEEHAPPVTQTRF